MFTGIVEELGTVEALEDQGDAVRLTVRGPLVTSDAGLGRLDLRQRLLPDRGRRTDRREPFTADVMQETLAKTSLGGARARRPGQPRARGHRRPRGSAATSSRATSTAPARWCAATPSEHWEVVEISLPDDLERYLVEGLDHRRRHLA